jgi:hypothetical protein
MAALCVRRHIVVRILPTDAVLAYIIES